MALDEVLGNLEQQQPLAADVLKMRFFFGMTIADAAGALGVSHATVERQWAYARSRLHAELGAGD